MPSEPRCMSAGLVAYQDLTRMPPGQGGFQHVSMLVDAYTRAVAGTALKSKDHALSHRNSYVRRVESEGLRVKRWLSDNV